MQEQILGYAAAFLTAMVVITVDCNTAVRKALRRVPINVLSSPAVWILAMVCGLIAAVCFRFSNSSFVTQIIELKWSYPPGRGFLVGIAVLTVLRSKFFNFKDTEIGGEFFYNSARAWAVDSLWQKWLRIKDAYTTPESLRAACGNPAFEQELLEAVRESINLQQDDFKKWVDEQFQNLLKNKPAAPVDCNDPKWILYLRILIRLALDYAGPQVLSRFPYFPRHS